MNSSTANPERHPDHAADNARARSGLYLLFAKIYQAEADATLLSELLEPSVIEAFADTGTDLKAIIPEPDRQQFIDQLAEEYTRLFLGPGHHVSPHESVQLENGDSRLWGKETGIVKRFIEAAGFDYGDSFQDIPDHISIELEFLGHLASREAKALDEGDEQSVQAIRQWQYKFLAEHLGLWVNRFVQTVKASASSEFYPAFGELLTQFIRSESIYLESILCD